MSRELFDRALEVMPGGVSSPVRSISPYPFFIDKGDGAYLIGEEGRNYIDYCMGYGPLLLGHGFPGVVESDIKSQFSNGNLYGTPTRIEVEFAEFIANNVSSIEKLRFVNTGTEATMSVLRTARGFTGKNKIVKIKGGFHGSYDPLLVEAGSGAFGKPDSDGVPRSFTQHTIQVPFNDIEAMEEATQGEDIAAVILEPIMANSGPILPEKEYLKEVRKITNNNDVLLIFDEVVTGFRLGLGGAQKYYGVEPDLTTLGKITGAGFPIGVFGGKREIMDVVAPSGDVYQAGTFSGNPITMTAGYSTLQFIERENVISKTKKLGKKLRKGIKDIISDKRPQYSVSGSHSFFKLFFSQDGSTPKNYTEAKKCDSERWKRIFWDSMKQQGVFLPPSQYETNFVSYSHTEKHIEDTLEAYKESI